MTEIYLHFLFAHYGLSGNAPVVVGAFDAETTEEVEVLCTPADIAVAAARCLARRVALCGSVMVN